MGKVGLRLLEYEQGEKELASAALCEDSCDILVTKVTHQTSSASTSFELRSYLLGLIV